MASSSNSIVVGAVIDLIQDVGEDIFANPLDVVLNDLLANAINQITLLTTQRAIGPRDALGNPSNVTSTETFPGPDANGVIVYDSLDWPIGTRTDTTDPRKGISGISHSYTNSQYNELVLQINTFANNVQQFLDHTDARSGAHIRTEMIVEGTGKKAEKKRAVIALTPDYIGVVNLYSTNALTTYADTFDTFKEQDWVFEEQGLFSNGSIDTLISVGNYYDKFKPLEIPEPGLESESGVLFNPIFGSTNSSSLERSSLIPVMPADLGSSNVVDYFAQINAASYTNDETVILSSPNVFRTNTTAKTVATSVGNNIFNIYNSLQVGRYWHSGSANPAGFAFPNNVFIVSGPSSPRRHFYDYMVNDLRYQNAAHEFMKISTKAKSLINLTTSPGGGQVMSEMGTEAFKKATDLD